MGELKHTEKNQETRAAKSRFLLIMYLSFCMLKVVISGKYKNLNKITKI